MRSPKWWLRWLFLFLRKRIPRHYIPRNDKLSFICHSERSSDSCGVEESVKPTSVTASLCHLLPGGGERGGAAGGGKIKGTSQRRTVFVGRGKAKIQAVFSASGKYSVASCALTKRVAEVSRCQGALTTKADAGHRNRNKGNGFLVIIILGMT